MVHPDHAFWWLHAPKTGSSFRNTLLDFPWSDDRDKTWPHGNHQLLSPDIATRIHTANVRVAAMFRKPEDRLLSSYYHMKDLVVPERRVRRRRQVGPVDCCWDDWGWAASVYSPVHTATAAGKPPEDVISKFKGCQTNMVLGRGCMSRYATSPRHVAQAIALVDKFEFVGDVAHWNLSICLFNVKATGRRYVLNHQLVNTRPTTSKQRGVRLNDTDSIDGALYAFAQHRFWYDVRKHGVSDACCPKYDAIERVPSVATEHATCHGRPVDRSFD